MLKPLDQDLKEFKKIVETTNKEGSIQHATLLKQIEYLTELNNKITSETQNLTKALKGDNKKVGDWGEVMLKRILDSSGLKEGINYKLQQNVKDKEGSNQRPDAIIYLPDDRIMIVDSKVSLKSYEEAFTTEDAEIRDKAIKAHIVSVGNHIRNLAVKRYQDLYEIESPDFVLMFIPVQGAFDMAVQNAAELFNQAYEKRIILVSPITLMVTLSTIESIWRTDAQNKNAREIAEEGGKLYDKFYGLVEAISDIGKHLTRAQESYQTAQKRLSDGQGNSISKVEKLKELGAKTSKQLDSN